MRQPQSARPARPLLSRLTHLLRERLHFTLRLHSPRAPPTIRSNSCTAAFVHIITRANAPGQTHARQTANLFPAGDRRGSRRSRGRCLAGLAPQDVPGRTGGSRREGVHPSRRAGNGQLGFSATQRPHRHQPFPGRAPQAGRVVRPADHPRHSGRQRAVFVGTAGAVCSCWRAIAGRDDAAGERGSVDGDGRREGTRFARAGGADRKCGRSSRRGRDRSHSRIELDAGGRLLRRPDRDRAASGADQRAVRRAGQVRRRLCRRPRPGDGQAGDHRRGGRKAQPAHGRPAGERQDNARQADSDDPARSDCRRVDRDHADLQLDGPPSAGTAADGPPAVPRSTPHHFRCRPRRRRQSARAGRNLAIAQRRPLSRRTARVQPPHAGSPPPAAGRRHGHHLAGAAQYDVSRRHDAGRGPQPVPLRLSQRSSPRLPLYAAANRAVYVEDQRAVPNRFDVFTWIVPPSR